MAGQYFYDPRPFYGHNGSTGLMPLDEVFYGRYEPVPYWMDQRMTPLSAFDDYDPSHKQMAMGRQLQQQYTYKRPESRDDLGMDVYRRSPYNFQGAGYGMQQPRQMSQDDTWVHAANHPHVGHGNVMIDQYRHMDQGYMPNSHNRGMDQMHGHNKSISMGGNTGNQGNYGSQGSQGNYSNQGSHGNHGSQGNNKMSGSSNQFGNKSNGSSNQFSNKSSGYTNGYENVKSSSQGGKSMTHGGNMKQQQQRYDSSSDDSDEEYENGRNNGVKWATKNSVKHGNGHQSITHMKSGNSKGGNNNSYGSSYDSVSSKKSGGHKSGGHTGGNMMSKSGGITGGNMMSKLLRFQNDDSSSSDSENEGYGHNKKSSSKMSHHGSHGNSFQSHGHQQQNKQMQYGSSQSKGVELKVPICCDNCERKVKECLEYMDGVQSVLCDQWTRKVIVYGNVKPENVLKRVRRVKKTAELWQQGKQQQQMMQQMRAY